MRRFSYLTRLQMLALASGLPGFASAMILLISGEYPLRIYLTVLLLGGGLWLFIALRLKAGIVHPLQSASNMLSALREGDYSLRPGYKDEGDALGQLMLEIGLLTQVLNEHRMEAIEAHSLLDKIISQVDAAVLAFNPERRITLANPRAVKILRTSRDELIGSYAAEWNLDSLLDNPVKQPIPHPVHESSARFAVRQGTFRVDGEPHSLLILIDVSRSLREEELMAWKRLIRVLGHEINNSMAPISSLSESLRTICEREELDEEDRQDLAEGLEVISQRAESLTRFIQDYARMAKLPEPRLKPMHLLPVVQQVQSLYQSDVSVELSGDCEDTQFLGDAAQLEQAILNILKNAIEATRAANSPDGVRICCEKTEDRLILRIEDTGEGIANPDNLFIPFFSTKKEGSGIGLTLSRQIVEGHGGSLRLENRKDRSGACAILKLPLEG